MTDNGSSDGSSRDALHAELIDAARHQHELAEVAGQNTFDAFAAPGRGAAVAPAPDSFAGYEILREVHRGGQGVVYQAFQKSTRRKVAIKVMREGPFAGPGDQARFDREIHILGQLNHPNIVAIHDTGVAAGCHYFVMDYIRGQPLDVYMASGSRSVDETLRLFAKIGEAVNAAHLQGIIHRDLKPGNIRVDASGEPHVLDFGLAKVLASDAEAAAMTMTGQFVGSLPWASPEQAEGAPAKIDIRTDVYSLGVILYQMLTGKFPYEVVGAMRDVLDRIMTVEPARPRAIRRQINDEVETMVLKCLAKERERRYQTAGELARDVRRYLAGEPIEAKRDSGWYLVRKSLRRHRVSLSAAGAFFVLTAASAILAWSLYGSAERARAAWEVSAVKAREAERDATGRLWDAYQAQARAARGTLRPGRRFDSLEALRRAAAIRPSLELRNEAIACMALFDIRLEREFHPPDNFSYPGFSRSLDRLALGKHDGEIIVLSTADGRELFRLPGRALSVQGLEFSPDGRFLAARYEWESDGHFVLWDLQRGEPVFELERGSWAQAAFGGDGRWVAVSHPDRAIHVYELPTGREWRVLSESSTSQFMAAHPFEPRLAVGRLADPAVRVWNVADGTVTATMSAPEGVMGVAWSGDGRRLAGACWGDYRVHVWDAESGELRTTLAGHQAEPVRVYFNPRGDLLASYAWGDGTRLWDVESAQQLLNMGFLADARGLSDEWIASGQPAQWRIEHAEGYHRLTAPARFRGGGFVSISPDGRLLASSGENGVLLWSLADGRPLATLSERLSGSALFVHDGAALVSTDDQGVHLWPLRRRGQGVEVGQEALLWRQQGLTRACLSADGRTVIVCGPQGPESLQVISVSGEHEPITVPAYRGVGGPAASPDGRFIAAGAWRGPCARVWDARTLEVAYEFPAQGAPALGTSFSPDGRWLVISAMGEYRFLDLDTWNEHHRIAWSRPRTQQAGPVAFSPDGAIAALPDASTVRLFDAAGGVPLATLEPPDAQFITHICFSPDGGTLAAATTDRTIQVWDLRRIRAQLADMGLDW